MIQFQLELTPVPGNIAFSALFNPATNMGKVVETARPGVGVAYLARAVDGRIMVTPASCATIFAHLAPAPAPKPEPAKYVPAAMRAPARRIEVLSRSRPWEYVVCTRGFCGESFSPDDDGLTKCPDCHTEYEVRTGRSLVPRFL
jgi:hypothetical protein